MKKVFYGFALAVGISVPALLAYAHCQIPCGIYGDSTRFDLMREDITTIEKSMNEINQISDAGDKNYNQLVRWVANKDDHADKLTDIVTSYFMAQRVKPSTTDDAKYVSQITTLHKIMVEAMKSKQTTDLEHVNNLRSLVDEFEGLYLTKEDKAHMMEHHGESH